MSDSNDAIQGLVFSLLKELGEDPGRPGLERTPLRVARALRFLTQGYQQDPQRILSDALYEASYDEMVLVKDIDFYSLCEHHLLPFFGKAHISYIPDGRIVGLSKLPRLVEMFARRLQVQEQMTTQIAETLQEALRPKGVGVVIEAIHLCLKMRGVSQQNAFAITSSVRGAFADDPKTRAEFLQLIRHHRDSFA